MNWFFVGFSVLPGLLGGCRAAPRRLQAANINNNNRYTIHMPPRLGGLGAEYVCPIRPQSFCD